VELARVDELQHEVADAERVEREVAVGGELDNDQRARLADICERTPVTLALKSGIEIRTTLK